MSAAQRASAALSPTPAQASWVAPYAQTLGNAYLPYAANVVWQDTSSNATYCSVSAALGGQP